jgi:hypothetical protein
MQNGVIKNRNSITQCTTAMLGAGCAYANFIYFMMCGDKITIALSAMAFLPRAISFAAGN